MPAKKKASSRRQQPELIHQFLVALTGTDPLVWRRIQVPERYSFWDLHVAIQDAMGWRDYHLHEFRLFDEAAQALVSIGIPTGEEAEDRPVIAGWDVLFLGSSASRVAMNHRQPTLTISATTGSTSWCTKDSSRQTSR